VCFYGLNRSAAAFLLTRIISGRPETYLVYMPTPLEAEDFVRDLGFFWPEGAKSGAILLLPGYEVSIFKGESPAADLVFARLTALYALLSGRRPLVVVTSAPGALQLSLPRQALSEAAQLLEANEEVDRESLVDQLVRSGYYSTSLVQSQGDLSVRGGILDLFPPGQPRPIRAEFFGDYIESLRTFRILDQRSLEEIKEIIVLPAAEVILTADRAAQAAAALESLARQAGWLDLLWKPLVEKIAQAQFFEGLESFLPLFYERLSSVEDYAPGETVRVVFEPQRLFEAAAEHTARLEADLDKVRAEERPHLPLDLLYLSPEALRQALQSGRLIEIGDLAFQDRNHETKTYNFSTETNEDLRLLIDRSRDSAGLLGPLAARIKAWLSRGLDVVLACHTREQARRLTGLLENYSLYPQLELDGVDRLVETGVRFRIVVGFLSAGFALPAFGQAFVTEDELFGPKRRLMRRAAEEVKGIHLSSFQDLGVGDFVVHADHGLGQYLGLVKLEVDGRPNDYLDLVYKDGDKLYVPVDRFNAVQKYIGSDDHPPALDRLGGASWERVKARIEASIREMAEELLKLYAARQVKAGYAFGHRDSMFREFEASFEYDETPDQIEAIDQVLEDMASAKPMDRLVCGDVGYGKTEVAVRAAFKAVQEGKQVALLVPTTVLAEQHFQTLTRRLQSYPVLIEVLSRFKRPSEQREIVRGLTAGQIDIIIGTHRLLQRDVVFKDLGLLIVDEEHRFGVTHKEKLKKLRTEVDVLALSATPIPRTLHMSLTGIRDLSTIQTPPEDRMAIKTYLLKFDETTICEAIGRELDRGGQVFLVHNRVKDIDLLTQRLKRLMPLVRFGVAHGQLKERDLEKVMVRFLRREIDVLVATTIIESGLDFPTANTIIINNADRLGLAQIYQLRGRVGRSTEQAYAYLLVSGEDNLTRDARKRLRALMDFSELGAGFKIALHDLQIRGAGNMLGAAQSGHIAAVGYEMYLQIMEKTISELKGEEYIEDFQPEIVLGLPAYIPEDYVPDTEQRLVHYRRLAAAGGAAELEDLATEMLDRYGPPPLEVENLLMVMELKPWLKKAGVKKLEMGGGGLTFSFVNQGRVDPDKILALVAKYPDQARLSPEGRLFLSLRGFDGPKGLSRVKNILQELV